MERHDKLYAIGSRFARGVENALAGRQMQALSRTTEFDAFPAVNNELKLGFANKYNTFLRRGSCLEPSRRATANHRLQKKFHLITIFPADRTALWWNEPERTRLPFARIGSNRARSVNGWLFSGDLRVE